MDKQLTIQEVRNVAMLARIRLNDEQISQYQNHLSAVLKHIDKLNELDVTGVEPMAHPNDFLNRLDEDIAVDSFTQDEVLSLAPKVEGEYLAVPKVLLRSDENV